MATKGRHEELSRIEEMLSGLDTDDLELAAPPAAVWDAIESTLSSAGRRPRASGSAGTTVEWSIDANDVVRSTGADWADFAEANGAPEMTALDDARTLWSYMGSDEVREPWKLLVQRARERRTSAKVTFRCDGPDVRRWFDLVLTPAADGSVDFSTTLVFEEDRNPIALLDQGVDRDLEAEPVELCAWCGRGRHGDEWLDVETLLAASRLLEHDPPPPLAYGICGSCRDGMAADLLVNASSTDP